MQQYFFEFNLRSFKILSDSQFDISASKLFGDISRTSLSRKSIFLPQNYTDMSKFVLDAVQRYCFNFFSKTSPKFVLAAFQIFCL